MKSQVVVKLSKHENILAVTPEHANGSGWSNWVIWVHILNNQTNEYRRIALQTDDLTVELLALLKPGAAMAEALKGAIKTETD